MKEPNEKSVETHDETIEVTPGEENTQSQVTRRMKVPMDTQTEAQDDERMETPVGAPLKERYKIEVAKLRQMPFKKKMEYIWEYYKIPIIAIILITAIIGSLINTIFINPAPQIVLAISWNAGYVFEEQIEDLKTSLQDKILDEYKNERIDVMHMFFTEDDPMISMANIQRLAAMVAAGAIDIFILSSDQLEDYSLTGYIQPMENILSEIKTLNPFVYESIEEKLTYALHELEDGSTVERIMGIDIKDAPLLSELNFFELERFLSLSITAVNRENAAKAIIAFFE